MLKLVLTIYFILILPFSMRAYIWVICARAIFLLRIITIFLLPIGLNIRLSNTFFFFFDGVRIPLVILMLWVVGLIIISRFKSLINKEMARFFILNLILLSFILLFCFIFRNYLLFYIIFEGSLVPTMILILIWGYQPERLQARLYFVIYTVIASLPLLVGLILIWSTNNRLRIILRSWVRPVIKEIEWVLWFVIFLAFLVKLPLYSIHLWLPKAHVEAPVAGSIILAAILLKLGSYGIIRVRIFFPDYNLKLISFLRGLSIIGACITRAICIRQPDIKSIIAYSSVGHIGFVVIGVLSFTNWGWCGAMGLIVAHGLCSSALFSIANIVYECIGRRSIILVKGLILVFPSISIWWFILCVANIRGPPSFNLFSEILLLVSILNSSLWYIITFVISRFLVGAFRLFLFTVRQHGINSNFLNPFNYIIARNHIVMFLHRFPLYIILVQPYRFFFII